jgi:copper resistance protein C
MKKSLVLLITFVLLIANNVSAHSILQSTSPMEGEIMKNEVTKLVLSFEAKIEEGSRLFLKNETNQEIPVTINVEEKELVANLSEPLDNGKYSVDWEVASTDGHTLNGSFTFEVAVEQTEEPKEEATDTNEDDQQEVKPEQENEPDDQNIQVNEEEKDASISYIIYGVIGLLIIAAIASLFIIKKK